MWGLWHSIWQNGHTEISKLQPAIDKPKKKFQVLSSDEVDISTKGTLNGKTTTNPPKQQQQQQKHS